MRLLHLTSQPASRPSKNMRLYSYTRAQSPLVILSKTYFFDTLHLEERVQVWIGVWASVNIMPKSVRNCQK
jgi:hypothetical protein